MRVRLFCVQRTRLVLFCVQRARRMLYFVAAGSAGVNGKLVAASEGERRRKLASLAQQLFAAGASHPPTSSNRWASRVIQRGTMYVHRCYVP